MAIEPSLTSPLTLINNDISYLELENYDDSAGATGYIWKYFLVDAGEENETHRHTVSIDFSGDSTGRIYVIVLYGSSDSISDSIDSGEYTTEQYFLSTSVITRFYERGVSLRYCWILFS